MHGITEYTNEQCEQEYLSTRFRESDTFYWNERRDEI